MQENKVTELRLSRFSIEDRGACEELLASHANALLYHTIAYKGLLEDILRCESEYWLAWEGKRVTGMLPMLWRPGPFGAVANSLPFFGSHGGPITVSEAAHVALWRVFANIASRPEVVSATVIEHPLVQEEPQMHWHLTDERIGQMSPLEGQTNPEQYILSMIDGSARRNIRKAQRSNVKVEIENDQLDFIAKVHRENMAALGGTPKPAVFFQKVPSHFRQDRDYRVYVARRSGNPVAGLLLFYFKRVVEYFVPVTVRSEREFQPMALILHRAMIDAASRGFILWNWGGTGRTQLGVYKFKQKWGARDFPYRYFTVLNNQAILNCAASELLLEYPNFFVVPFRHLLST
jgi:hypothetical protein